MLPERRQVTTVPPPVLNTNFSHSNYTSSPDSARSNPRTMERSALAEIPRRDSNQESSSPSRPTNASPSTSKNSTSPADKYPSYEENGRRYHSYRKGVYLYPCDEQEQDRLDIFHKLFRVARFDHLHYAPLYRPPTKANGQSGAVPVSDQGPRVLDLGCGTGIWAMEMAQAYPNAYVLGIDLAAIQPPNRPPNCDFHAPRDFESPWALGEDSWDLINLRMGCGSVSSWPSLYRKAFAHLRPGTGYFEQLEIDFKPRCDNADLPESMLLWYEHLKDATESVKKPIAFQKNTKQMLEEAGFVEVEHQWVGLPLNPWPNPSHEKDVGRWYNLALSESLETLSLAPFSRCYNWPVDRIRKYAAEVKSHAFNKEIHAFHLLHIYIARKPFPHEQTSAT